MKALSRGASSLSKGRFSMRKSTSKKENATGNDNTFESNTPHWEAPLKRAETDAILAEDEANQLLESATAAAVDLEEVKKDTAAKIKAADEAAAQEAAAAAIKGALEAAQRDAEAAAEKAAKEAAEVSRNAHRRGGFELKQQYSTGGTAGGYDAFAPEAAAPTAAAGEEGYEEFYKRLPSLTEFSAGGTANGAYDEFAPAATTEESEVKPSAEEAAARAAAERAAADVEAAKKATEAAAAKQAEEARVAKAAKAAAERAAYLEALAARRAADEAAAAVKAAAAAEQKAKEEEEERRLMEIEVERYKVERAAAKAEEEAEAERLSPMRQNMRKERRASQALQVARGSFFHPADPVKLQAAIDQASEAGVDASDVKQAQSELQKLLQERLVSRETERAKQPMVVAAGEGVEPGNGLAAFALEMFGLTQAAAAKCGDFVCADEATRRRMLDGSSTSTYNAPQYEDDETNGGFPGELPVDEEDVETRRERRKASQQLQVARPSIFNQADPVKLQTAIENAEVAGVDAADIRQARAELTRLAPMEVIVVKPTPWEYFAKIFTCTLCGEQRIS